MFLRKVGWLSTDYVAFIICHQCENLNSCAPVVSVFSYNLIPEVSCPAVGLPELWRCEHTWLHISLCSSENKITIFSLIVCICRNTRTATTTKTKRLRAMQSEVKGHAVA